MGGWVGTPAAGGRRVHAYMDSKFLQYRSLRCGTFEEAQKEEEKKLLWGSPLCIKASGIVYYNSFILLYSFSLTKGKYLLYCLVRLNVGTPVTPSRRLREFHIGKDLFFTIKLFIDK
jgi:hypothetical protein